MIVLLLTACLFIEGTPNEWTESAPIAAASPATAGRTVMPKQQVKPTSSLLNGAKDYIAPVRPTWFTKLQKERPQFAKSVQATVDAFVDGALPNFPTPAAFVRWMLEAHGDKINIGAKGVMNLVEKRRADRGRNA
jgi:hypothetical protein